MRHGCLKWLSGKETGAFFPSCLTYSFIDLKVQGYRIQLKGAETDTTTCYKVRVIAVWMLRLCELYGPWVALRVSFF